MKKQKIIPECSVCGKSKRNKEDSHDFSVHLDQWGYHGEELERYYEDYDLIPSHGYCEECLRAAMEEVERWRLKQNAKHE